MQNADQYRGSEDGVGAGHGPELRERRDRRLALGVEPQGLGAAALGGADVLLPLVEREALVDEGEDVGGRPAGRVSTCAICWEMGRGEGRRERRGKTREDEEGKAREKPAGKKDSLQLLELDGTVELLHCILETLLVQQELPAAHPRQQTPPGQGQDMLLTSNSAARSASGTPSTCA